MFFDKHIDSAAVVDTRSGVDPRKMFVDNDSLSLIYEHSDSDVFCKYQHMLHVRDFLVLFYKLFPGDADAVFNITVTIQDDEHARYVSHMRLVYNHHVVDFGLLESSMPFDTKKCVRFTQFTEESPFPVHNVDDASDRLFVCVWLKSTPVVDPKMFCVHLGRIWFRPDLTRDVRLRVHSSTVPISLIQPAPCAPLVIADGAHTIDSLSVDVPNHVPSMFYFDTGLDAPSDGDNKSDVGSDIDVCMNWLDGMNEEEPSSSGEGHGGAGGVAASAAGAGGAGSPRFSADIDALTRFREGDGSFGSLGKSWGIESYMTPPQHPSSRWHFVGNSNATIPDRARPLPLPTEVRGTATLWERELVGDVTVRADLGIDADAAFDDALARFRSLTTSSLTDLRARIRALETVEKTDDDTSTTNNHS